MLKLSDIVTEESVVPSLQGSDRAAVVGELVAALVAAGVADAKCQGDLVTRILDREKLSSTGFGKGVAVPHAKHKSIKRMTAAIGLSPRGVEFNALDRQPVYTVFLLLSPEDKPEEHLRAMEVIFKNLSRDQFRRSLRQASSVQDVRAVLEEADGQQLAP